MLCSHKKQFIYFKTKKTASTSVETLFERHCVPDSFGEIPVGTGELITEVGVIGARRDGQKKDDRFYNHMPAAQVRAALGDAIFSRYFKFAVVRNPFDKTVSRFWWLFRNSPDKLASLNAGDFGMVRKLFTDYVRERGRRLVDDRNAYAIEGRSCVDKFICFERLEPDLAEVCAKLGIHYAEGDLGNYNRGARRRPEHFSDYYDADTLKIVRSVFAPEIEHFGYECTAS